METSDRKGAAAMIILENGPLFLNAEGRRYKTPEIPADEARKNSMARQILHAHSADSPDGLLHLRFDALVSPDNNYVSILQSARAVGLERFPVPYVLTNCHNSLCAVGGTINEDDHVFGLSCAKKYGGVYVPPHMAVIHQFAREMLSKSGDMILGSDSHT